MNQNPEQMARETIDRQLAACGWIIQNRKEINLHAGPGVAVREYRTDVGPADYVLFVDGMPVGIIEAKRQEEGGRLAAHEDQVEGYAEARLKYLDNKKLSFVNVGAPEKVIKTNRAKEYLESSVKKRVRVLSSRLID